MLSDSPAIVLNMMLWCVPFAAYFLGIVIRKVALPGKSSPPLRNQLLLGIPFSLIVVSPLLVVFRESGTEPAAYLVTIGIIIEHGMIVTETATRQLQTLIGNTAATPPVATRKQRSAAAAAA
ncbi:MAG TPA: hypothetical protein VFL57_19565 [Bryobacteraceae bacterium]|nr:hypothetical protein [Bryobacteraceae bacterium]